MCGKNSPPPAKAPTGEGVTAETGSRSGGRSSGEDWRAKQGLHVLAAPRWRRAVIDLHQPSDGCAGPGQRLRCDLKQVIEGLTIDRARSSQLALVGFPPLIIGLSEYEAEGEPSSPGALDRGEDRIVGTADFLKAALGAE